MVFNDILLDSIQFQTQNIIPYPCQLCFILISCEFNNIDQTQDSSVVKTVKTQKYLFLSPSCRYNDITKLQNY